MTRKSTKICFSLETISVTWNESTVKCLIIVQSTYIINLGTKLRSTNLNSQVEPPRFLISLADTHLRLPNVIVLKAQSVLAHYAIAAMMNAPEVVS